MGLNFEEVNILGDIINHTWGKASTGESAHVSVTCSLQGETLSVLAMEVVNTLDATHMRQEVSRAEDELNQHINKYIRELKKEFKDHAGRALVCKQIKDSEDTNVELVHFSPHSPKRASYVRRRISYEIG